MDTHQQKQTSISFLNQQQAAAVDEELMGPLGFSVDQLMELAGLSVACAVTKEYPNQTHKNVLVIAGPGNNGGDGLVAARHLHHFGYTVSICYPRPTDKPLYNGLVVQIKSLGIQFLEMENILKELRKWDVIIDAMFGFSFRGEPRPPFDSILNALVPSQNPPAIVAVDIPSGWQVESGDESGQGMRPEMLVSLTAPKLCAQKFEGAYHYLGGRFVPPAIRDKYDLKLPSYPGTEMCVIIGEESSKSPINIADMRNGYKFSDLQEADMNPDPMQQFDDWFRFATNAKVSIEPNAMAIATSSSANRPSVRMVLLKGYDDRGFTFYTNYNSRKGTELLTNGNAAMCMWWEKLERSVRVEGTIEKLSSEESDAYYSSRPRGSQIGAWVSNQSELIKTRAVLEQRNEELKEKYKDESVPIPRPDNWGGFLIRPSMIEFWQGRESRLHDRLRYRRMDNGEWIIERLSP